MKKTLTTLMTVALAVGVLAPTAHADMKLRLDDGLGHQVTLTDGNGDGVIVYNSFDRPTGELGNWLLNVTTGTSKPFIGGTMVPMLDLNSVNASSSAGGTLTITLTDTGFYPGPSWTSTKLISAIGGTTAGTVALDQILDVGNAEFPLLSDAELLVSLGMADFTFAGPAFAGSGTDFSSLVSGPFSLTEIAVITHTGAGLTSFDATSEVVPVPGAILLGFLGLGAAGLKLRRFA